MQVGEFDQAEFYMKPTVSGLFVAEFSFIQEMEGGYQPG
jgi:hypothetical protein